MHELIAVLVDAPTETAAVERVDHEIHARDGGALSSFRYGMTLDNESARYRSSNTVAEEFLDTGALRADSEDAHQLVESLWDSQLAELTRYLAVIEQAVESVSDPPALLDNPRVEVNIDPHDMLGIGDGDSDSDAGKSVTTTERSLFMALREIASNTSTAVRIYDFASRGYCVPVTGPSEYELFQQQMDDAAPTPTDTESASASTSDEPPTFIVPLDAKF